MLARFSAPLTAAPADRGSTYVVMHGSADFFGASGRVKVTGTMDGVPFASSFTVLGDGTHRLPVKAGVLRSLRKGVGDEVDVVIETAEK